MSVLIFCCFALAGCTELVPACPTPSEVRPVDGHCGPPDGGSGGRDSAVDAATDSDASGCDCATDPCVADVCVECVVDADCPGEVCDTTAHECVACNTSSDCPADQPTCEDRVCMAICDRDLCLANFPGAAPACAPEGQCVRCLPDANEGADCGGNSCDPNTRACTETRLGDLSLCEPCVRSTECDTHTIGGIEATMACVDTEFGDPIRSVGSYCLVEFAATDCPNGTPNPIERAAVDQPTDDMTAHTYCTPVTVTTCRAVFDTSTCSGMDASECGLPSTNDSTCSTSRCRSRCDVLEPIGSCGIEGEMCRDAMGEPDFCRR